jgi:hypothetical protein
MKKICVLLLAITIIFACTHKRRIPVASDEIMPAQTTTPTAQAAFTMTGTAAVTASVSPSCTMTVTLSCTPSSTFSQTSTPTATITSTVLYTVDVSLIHDTSTGNNSTAWILISQPNNTPYPDATITVDGVLIPYSGAFFTEGSYMLSNVWVYNPGQQAVISITMDGQTGTFTTAPLPGGISMTPDGMTVSWTSPITPGQFSAITIKNSANTTTLNAGLGLTSPYSVPASAYPAPDTYHIQISMENDLPTDYNAPGIIWAGSLLVAYEMRQYDITK